MTDIEVKRKELETAKRIRDSEYDCTEDDFVVCSQCPFEGKDSCTNTPATEWDAFISTREAELAALEETPKERHPIEFVGHKVYAPGAISAGEPSFQFTQYSPTLDDFALALIQGGYYPSTMQSEDGAKWLYRRAEEVKAESDARREA